MSVDDAFRRIMRQAPAPEASPAPAPAAEAAPPPEEIPAQGAPAESPAPEPLPEPAAPALEPVAFDRVRHIDRFDYTVVEERSQIAEEYRILRTRLQIINPSRNSVMFTSCRHGEGKTSTALNLAFIMAKRQEHKILLIDLDLRRPRVARNLNLKCSNGVVEAIRGSCTVEEAMLYSETENLYVLPARREYTNATEILESPSMRIMLDRLHANFDFILIDTCPCLSTADPMIVGPMTGGAVMVVRTRVTQRESVEHAVLALQEHEISTLGFVLTFVKFFIPRYFYRYQYYHDAYYYYNRYGAEPDEAAAKKTG